MNMELSWKTLLNAWNLFPSHGDTWMYKTQLLNSQYLQEITVLCISFRVEAVSSLYLYARCGVCLTCWLKRPRWSRGSVLAFGTEVRGSNPTEAVGFFRAKKILSAPSFGGEVKPSVPCRRFTACKRSMNVTCKSGIFRQNSSVISRPC